MARTTKANLEEMKLMDEFIRSSSELWILKQRVSDLEGRCKELAKKVDGIIKK